MKDLRQRRAEIDLEIVAAEQTLAVLKAKRALILELMGEAPNEVQPAVSSVQKRAPRANVKQTLIDLLEEVKVSGLNAAIAVDMARERNIRLERATVSSLLSRMKNDQIVVHGDGVYRLKEYATETRGADQPSASVHPLRASGDAP